MMPVAISPDDRQILTGGSDRTAYLWDAATGKKLHAFKIGRGEASAVAFSPDGRRVLTLSDRFDMVGRDAESGKAFPYGAGDGLKGHADRTKFVAILTAKIAWRN